MIKLLTGTSRHEADPFHSICWMPCEMWPEGSNASAVTEPISARRRVSDLAKFVYKRANFAGIAPGLWCAEIASSMSRRAYRPENTRTFSVGNDLKFELSKPAWLLVLQVNHYVEYLATLSFRPGSRLVGVATNKLVSTAEPCQ
ncbi:MAG TPA: hypothetical protein VIJ58_13090 [Candidatus Dormibacteraeota bacterium]